MQNFYKQRFFALLHYARKHRIEDKTLQHCVYRIFQYAYKCGWEDKPIGEANA